VGTHYDGGNAERFDLRHNAPEHVHVGAGFDDDVLMGSVDGQIYRIARIVTRRGNGAGCART
jgi:hypothetical protein